MNRLQLAVLRMCLAPGLILLVVAVDQRGLLPDTGGILFTLLLAGAGWFWYLQVQNYRVEVRRREAEIEQARRDLKK